MEPQNPQFTVQQQPVINTTPLHSQSEESMWGAFQNVLSFISLAFFSGSLHALWSTFVSHWLPKKTDIYYYYGSDYLLNYSIATLLVSAPIFITLFLLINKKYIQQPDLKKVKSKKTLNYITLVITFIILIVRTISAINTALSDAFTLSFGLNLIITFVIYGIIFAFYLYETRVEKEPSNYLVYVIWSILITVVVIATMITAFVVRSDVKQKTKLKNELTYQYDNYQNPPRVDTASATPKTYNYQTPTPPVLDNPISGVVAVSTNLPSTKQTIQGIDFSIENAQVVKSDYQNILVLDLLFEANSPCPLTGGAVCGINSLGIKGVDKDGFLLERTKLNDPETIKDTTLRQGEKKRGKYYFNLGSVSYKYFITYNSSSGETSAKVEVQMVSK